MASQMTPLTLSLLSDDLADVALTTARYMTEDADVRAPGSSEGRRCFAVFSDVVQFAVCTRRRMLPRCTHPEAQREGVASESPSTLTDVVCTPCTPPLVDVIVTQLGWRSPNSWWSSDRYLIQIIRDPVLHVGIQLETDSFLRR